MTSEPASGNATRRFIVSGRVQRVGFRASVRRRAIALGVHGCARNLPDGRVEVCASGAPDALRALRDWLSAGPVLARVDNVEECPAVPVQGPGFLIA